MSRKRLAIPQREPSLTVGLVPCQLYVTELMGSETFVFVQLGREKIVARAPGDLRAEVESKVWIEFYVAKAHLFDASSGERM